MGWTKLSVGKLGRGELSHREDRQTFQKAQSMKLYEHPHLPPLLLAQDESHSYKGSLDSFLLYLAFLLLGYG